MSRMIKKFIGLMVKFMKLKILRIKKNILFLFILAAIIFSSCTDQRDNCKQSLTFGENTRYNQCRRWLPLAAGSVASYQAKYPNYDVLTNPFFDMALVNCIVAERQIRECNKQSKYLPVFKRMQ